MTQRSQYADVGFALGLRVSGGNPGKISFENAKISVREGKTLSVIGGDVDIGGGLPSEDSDNNPLRSYSRPAPQPSEPPPEDDDYDTYLFTPSGLINLVSNKSSGEISLSSLNSDSEIALKGGNIRIKNSVIGTGVDGSGGIYIRSGEIEMEKSVVFSETDTEQAGGKIDICADKMKLTEYVQINNDTRGKDSGGNIHIRLTDSLEMSDSGIFSNSYDDEESVHAGKAGDIDIKARQIEMDHGAKISSNTWAALSILMFLRTSFLLPVCYIIRESLLTQKMTTRHLIRGIQEILK